MTSEVTAHQMRESAERSVVGYRAHELVNGCLRCIADIARLGYTRYAVDLKDDIMNTTNGDLISQIFLREMRDRGFEVVEPNKCADGEPCSFVYIITW